MTEKLGIIYEYRCWECGKPCVSNRVAAKFCQPRHKQDYYNRENWKKRKESGPNQGKPGRKAREVKRVRKEDDNNANPVLGPLLSIPWTTTKTSRIEVFV